MGHYVIETFDRLLLYEKQKPTTAVLPEPVSSEAVVPLRVFTHKEII